MHDKNEKDIQKKAGSPVFILVIFCVLLLFVLVIPEIYKRYDREIANFLGIGSSKKEERADKDSFTATSDFYLIAENKSFSFNDITIETYSIENGEFKISLSSNDSVDLDNSSYYLEFYQGKTKFLGRRIFTGTLEKVGDYTFDLSNMVIDTSTYIMITRIEDSAVGGNKTSSDESGLSTLKCKKGSLEYEYEFYLNKLSKVTYSEEYSSNDLHEYAEAKMEFERREKEYDEYNGVDASIVVNDNNILFVSKFDYKDISSFKRIGDDNLFLKDTKDNLIDFKMEAKGFDCE